MARPIKEGLEFFSTNVTHFNDMKIKRLIRSKGNRAIGILLNIYTKVFETSYYAEFNDDLSFIISDELREDENFVNSVVFELAELSVIDKDILIKYGIITSEVIQDMYFTAIVRRKKATLISEIMLRNPTQYFDSSKESDPIIEMVSITEADSSRKVNVNNNLVHVNNVLAQISSKGIIVDVDNAVNEFSEVTTNNNEIVNANNNSINGNSSTQRESEIQIQIQREIDIENDIDKVADSSESSASFLTREIYLKNYFKDNPHLGIFNSNTNQTLQRYDNQLSVEVVDEALRRAASKHKRCAFAIGMLKNWGSDPEYEVKTIEDIEAYEQAYHSQRSTEAIEKPKPFNESDPLPF